MAFLCYRGATRMIHNLKNVCEALVGEPRFELGGPTPP
jgi:hypothetical protein